MKNGRPLLFGKRRANFLKQGRFQSPFFISGIRNYFSSALICSTLTVVSHLHAFTGMTALHKRIKFKKDVTEYFHLNFSFSTHPLFPELDWLMLNYHLKRLAEIHKVELQAFVMMSSHVHLLFKAAKYNENYFTEALLKDLKISTVEESLVEPIENMAQFLNCYKYIYRNPVEAQMIQKCEDYRFSSLHGLLGKGEILTPVIDPLCVTQNPLKILNWLNNNFQEKLFRFNVVDSKGFDS